LHFYLLILPDPAAIVQYMAEYVHGMFNPYREIWDFFAGITLFASRFLRKLPGGKNRNKPKRSDDFVRKAYNPHLTACTSNAELSRKG